MQQVRGKKVITWNGGKGTLRTQTHTQLLSEEEMLLGKTQEPTISFPVVAAGAETLML